MTIPGGTGTQTRTTAPAVVFLAAAGALWAIRLAFGSSPWPDGAAALLAGGLLLLHTVLAVGAALAAGRWISIATLGLLAADLGVALALPGSVTWWLALASITAAAVWLWRRSVLAAMAATPRPGRVPPAATTLALALAATPALVGAAGYDGLTVGGWVYAGAGLILAWAYMRARVGALWLARTALPLLAVWAIIGLPLAAAIAVAVAAIGTAALAWTGAALAAANPLAPERVAPVPILPEMVPPEILQSAGFDRRGRPKSTGDS